VELHDRLSSREACVGVEPADLAVGAVLLADQDSYLPDIRPAMITLQRGGGLVLTTDPSGWTTSDVSRNTESEYGRLASTPLLP
jgi:hypothetical protein